MKSKFITEDRKGFRVWDDDNSGANRFVFQNHIGFPYLKPKYFELLPFFHRKMPKNGQKVRQNSKVSEKEVSLNQY